MDGFSPCPFVCPRLLVGEHARKMHAAPRPLVQVSHAMEGLHVAPVSDGFFSIKV